VRDPRSRCDYCRLGSPYGRPMGVASRCAGRKHRSRSCGVQARSFWRCALRRRRMQARSGGWATSYIGLSSRASMRHGPQLQRTRKTHTRALRGGLRGHHWPRACHTPTRTTNYRMAFVRHRSRKHQPKPSPCAGGDRAAGSP